MLTSFREEPAIGSPQGSGRWIALPLGLLSLVYVVYCYRQSYDLFYEAEFLHIDFLRDLVAGRFAPSSFFTTFAEHLFPGYNLLLAINYRIFHVWGGFDGAVSAITVIATACLVSWFLFRRSSGVLWMRWAMAVCVAFLLMSPVNNPMWGMALAAQVGTLLAVISALLLDRAYFRAAPEWLLFLIVPATILLFSGGYGVGYIAAILVCSVLWIYLSGRPIWFPGALIAVTVLSLLVYVAIVVLYGDLLSNRPAASIASVFAIARFAVLMLGASLLGRSVVEATESLSLHYACGFVVLVCLVVFGVRLLWRFWNRDIHRTDFFILFLLIYSLATVSFVSMFRVANGFDGALGQWYAAHTKFIGVFVLVGAWDLMIHRRRWVVVPAVFAILFALYCSFSGYVADFRKAPYTRQWKERIALAAPRILADPAIINDTDLYKTLLWEPRVVKPGIEFLYTNSLWLFRHRAILLQGLQSDQWMTADKDVVVVCPAHTKRLTFKTFRPGEASGARFMAFFKGGTAVIGAGAGQVGIDFPSEIAAVVLSAKDVAQSKPLRSASDQRQLVSLISDLTCQLDGPPLVLQPD